MLVSSLLLYRLDAVAEVDFNFINLDLDFIFTLLLPILLLHPASTLLQATATTSTPFPQILLTVYLESAFPAGPLHVYRHRNCWKTQKRIAKKDNDEREKKRKDLCQQTPKARPGTTADSKRSKAEAVGVTLVEERAPGNQQKRQRESQPISIPRDSAPAAETTRRSKKEKEKETKHRVEKGKKDKGNKKKAWFFCVRWESDIRSDLNPARIQPPRAKERSVRTLKGRTIFVRPRLASSPHSPTWLLDWPSPLASSPFDLAKIQPAGPIFGYRATLWP